MTRRIKWLDIAKGIGILSIIAGHYGGDSKVYSYLYSFLTAYHVGIFFIISGYTLKKKDITKELLKKKFSSLMKPYFITCLILTILLIVKFLLVGNNYGYTSIPDILKKMIINTLFMSGYNTAFFNIELYTCIGAVWFLPALFTADIITLYLLNKTGKLAHWLISLLLAVIAVFSAKHFWLPFSIQSALLAVIFVLSGYYLKEEDILNKIPVCLYPVMAVLLFVCVYFKVAGMHFVDATLDNVLLSPICCISASLLIFKISSFLENITPLLWIGQNSLYILCVHLILLKTHLVDSIVRRLSLPGFIYYFVIMSSLCLTITFIYKIMKLLKKTEN